VFGINPAEFLVLAVVAAVVLGPERLPEYAAQLARLVREMRKMAQGASAQVRDELGPEFDDIDWRKLDPRQYDPRRIVREALADVWDPDDPLGLKDGNQADRTGGESNGVSFEKAQSPGGPAAATGPTPRLGQEDVPVTPAASNGAVTPAPAADPPPVAFDPDAT
jgi:sec-independent protein translocase protein TatB